MILSFQIVNVISPALAQAREGIAKPKIEIELSIKAFGQSARIRS